MYVYMFAHVQLLEATPLTSYAILRSTGPKVSHLAKAPEALLVHVPNSWTPKVCRIIIAFYGYWAIVLLTLGGLGLRIANQERVILPATQGQSRTRPAREKPKTKRKKIT